MTKECPENASVLRAWFGAWLRAWLLAPRLALSLFSFPVLRTLYFCSICSKPSQAKPRQANQEAKPQTDRCKDVLRRCIAQRVQSGAAPLRCSATCQDHCFDCVRKIDLKIYFRGPANAADPTKLTTDDQPMPCDHGLSQNA